MSGAETPKFDANFTPINAALTETSPPPNELSVVDRTHALRETLDFCRQPDAMSHTFSFGGAALDHVRAPEEVYRLAKKYGNLDSIDIHCSYLHESGGTSYDIVFEFCDAQMNVTRLIVNRPYSYYLSDNKTQDYDYVFDGEYEDDLENSTDSISPLGKEELNRCIASLLYNDSSLDDGVLDLKDWYGSEYNELTNILTQAANTASSTSMYLFNDAEDNPAGALEFETVRDTVLEMRLYRIDNQKIEVSPDGEIGYSEKATEMLVDTLDPTRTRFISTIRLDSEEYHKAFTPTETDYQSLMQFINEQIEQAHTAWADKSASDQDQQLN